MVYSDGWPVAHTSAAPRAHIAAPLKRSLASANAPAPPLEHSFGQDPRVVVGPYNRSYVPHLLLPVVKHHANVPRPFTALYASICQRLSPGEPCRYGKMRGRICPGGHMPQRIMPRRQDARSNLSWWPYAPANHAPAARCAIESVLVDICQEKLAHGCPRLPTGSKPDRKVRLCEASNLYYCVRGR